MVKRVFLEKVDDIVNYVSASTTLVEIPQFAIVNYLVDNREVNSSRIDKLELHNCFKENLKQLYMSHNYLDNICLTNDEIKSICKI